MAVGLFLEDQSMMSEQFHNLMIESSRGKRVWIPRRSSAV